MTYYTKQQMKQILVNKPSNVSDQEIVSELVSRGHTIEGLNEPKKPIIKSGIGIGVGQGVAPISSLNLAKSFVEKAPSIFPGKEIGEAVGTAIAKGQLGTTIQKAVTGRDLSKEEEATVTSNTTPGRIAADVAQAGLMVASPTLKAPATILGKAAQLGGLSGASTALGGIAEAKPTEQILEETKKSALTGAAVGTAFGILEKGTKALGDWLQTKGEKIQTTVIKPSQADIKDGFNVKNIKKYDLGGNLKDTFSKTDTKLDDLSKQLNEKLAASKKKIDIKKVYENTAKRLIGNNLENFGSNAQMDGALTKLGDEIFIASPTGKVAIPDAQTIKRAAGHFGAWSFGNQAPEIKASEKVYNTFYNELKTAIEKASPVGVKEINKQLSELIPIMNAVIRRIPVAERNNLISLTDVISATGAVIDPKGFGLTLLNLASKSGKVGSALTKAPELGQKVSGLITGVEPIAKTAVTRKK